MAPKSRCIRAREGSKKCESQTRCGQGVAGEAVGCPIAAGRRRRNGCLSRNGFIETKVNVVNQRGPHTLAQRATTVFSPPSPPNSLQSATAFESLSLAHPNLPASPHLTHIPMTTEKTGPHQLRSACAAWMRSVPIAPQARETWERTDRAWLQLCSVKVHAAHQPICPPPS